MMMSEHVKRLLVMMFEIFISPAIRLARAAAVRAELESYTALFEEARALEEGGQTRLAEHVRREVDGILNSSSSSAACPVENGDRVPFALESSSEAEPRALERRALNEAEGEGSPPKRRRGRRPAAARENEGATDAMKNGEVTAAAVDASAQIPQRAELLSENEESPAKNEATAEQTKPEQPLDMNSEERF